MLCFSNKKIAKVYLGQVSVSGSSTNPIAIYYIDTDTRQQMSVPTGVDVLNRITPTKTGYTFVGWREDTTASSTVLTSKTMGSSGIALYAVFKKEIKLTCFNGSSTSTEIKGDQYYNNGNIVNPKLSITQTAKSGWTAIGWGDNTAGDASVIYSSISNREFSDNATLYGLYNKKIKLTTVLGGVSTPTEQTKYYNSYGNQTNPKFTVSNPSISGAVFKGWSSSSTSSTIANSTISNLELSEDTIRYAVFTYNDTTLRDRYDTYYGDWGNTRHTILTGIDGTKYESLTVTVNPYTLECAAWAIACHAHAYVRIVSGSTTQSEIELRHTATWVIYTPEGQEPEQDEQRGYPCEGGRSATVTLALGNVANQSLIYAFEGDVFKAEGGLSTVTVKGRTVVG